MNMMNKPLREGVFTKEKDNICNLPTLAKIELHRSKETGHYYLNFIEWVSGWNNGFWQNQEIPEDMARLILSCCYPEHIEYFMDCDMGKVNGK